MPDPALARRLAVALGTAASYNDKGFYWRRDAPASIEAHRQSFQATLDGLASAIGAEALGPDLAEAIASGAAARDDSGVFAELAQRRFQLPDGSP